MFVNNAVHSTGCSLTYHSVNEHLVLEKIIFYIPFSYPPSLIFKMDFRSSKMIFFLDHFHIHHFWYFLSWFLMMDFRWWKIIIEKSSSKIIIFLTIFISTIFDFGWFLMMLVTGNILYNITSYGKSCHPVKKKYFEKTKKKVRKLFIFLLNKWIIFKKKYLFFSK